MYSSSNDTFFNFSIEKSVWAPCWNNSHVKPTVTRTGMFTVYLKSEELSTPGESRDLLRVQRGPYPGEDGEEAEGDGRPGGVTALPQGVVLRLGHLPLVRQETEAHKPHEGPERWKKVQGWCQKVELLGAWGTCDWGALCGLTHWVASLA